MPLLIVYARFIRRSSLYTPPRCRRRATSLVRRPIRHEARITSEAHHATAAAATAKRGAEEFEVTQRYESRLRMADEACDKDEMRRGEIMRQRVMLTLF